MHLSANNSKNGFVRILKMWTAPPLPSKNHPKYATANLPLFGWDRQKKKMLADPIANKKF